MLNEMKHLAIFLGKFHCEILRVAQDDTMEKEVDTKERLKAQSTPMPCSPPLP